MGLIDELLFDGLLGGFGPSTSRGMCALAALFGLGVAGASGWVLWKGVDPLHGPEWAFNLLLLTVIGAPVAVFFSAVVAVREREERDPAILAIITNSAALTLAITAVAT